MTDKYPIQIFWSEEDTAYVAICKDFPGLSAIGETREKALSEAQKALKLMIETFDQKKIPLPKPKTLLEVA